MLNLLIANKKFQNLHNLQNCISQYIPDIRVGHLATTGKDILEALKTQHYDIVLMDTHLDDMDGFDVLQKLSPIQQIEYNNSFIVTAHNETVIKNLNNLDLVYYAFSDTKSFSTIIGVLKKYLNSCSVDPEKSCIKNKILNELQSIGFNLAHKGTHYIAESVVVMATTKEHNENLTKDIYPQVSKIYNKPVCNIKCNITGATEAACKNITNEMLNNYFKLSGPIKPTSKMIMRTILKRLKLNS